MLINELAKKSGVSAHTIRFYEKMGLIKGVRKPEVTSNNYFHYSEDCLNRLILIIDAKEVGFSLAEIGDLINAWYDKSLSMVSKIGVMDKKIESIDLKIKELNEMKNTLNQYKKDIRLGICY